MTTGRDWSAMTPRDFDSDKPSAQLGLFAVPDEHGTPDMFDGDGTGVAPATTEAVRTILCTVCLAQPTLACSAAGDHYARYLRAADQGIINPGSLPPVPDGYGVAGVRIVPAGGTS